MFIHRLFFSQKSVCLVPRIALTAIILSAGIALGRPTAVSAQDMGQRAVTQFVPHLEWSIDDVTSSGNAFDVVATVTFIHASGKKHVTEMFYDGNNTFKFRFAGVLTGDWSFKTSSSNAKLNGHTGKVTVTPNPNPKVRGFMVASGNQFARQVDNTKLEPFILNVFQNAGDETTWKLDRYDDQKTIDKYLNEAESNGFNAIAIPLYHHLYKRGALSYQDHKSENPDLSSFRTFEKIFTTANQRGLRFHGRVWHDEDRKRTCIGLRGGCNGEVDRRMQRYMAARWGAIVGWSLTYGSDLEEWAKDGRVGAWAKNMHEKLGWDHILTGRGKVDKELKAIALSNYGGSGYPKSYSDVVRDITRQAGRPHLYEERYHYQRYGYYSQDNTRKSLWSFLMAGGAGSWWGYGPWDKDAKKGPYPNPEQFRTYRDFWQSHFQLGMARDNSIVANGMGLRALDHSKYIAYKENTFSIELKLGNLKGSAQVIAVDTKAAYKELPLGTVLAGTRTFELPKSSDWAIAVGETGKGGNAPSAPLRPALAVQP